MRWQTTMKCVAAKGQNSFSTAILKLAKIMLKNSTALNAYYGKENMNMNESPFLKKMKGSRKSGKTLFPQLTV